MHVTDLAQAMDLRMLVLKSLWKWSPPSKGPRALEY
jgi:hypothetical protein